MSNDPNGTAIPDELSQGPDPRCTKAPVDFATLEVRVLAAFRDYIHGPDFVPEFRPRRHSMPPAGASACGFSTPEIRDEMIGRGLIDHSGRARKPITPKDEREILRKADQDRRFARIDWRDPEIARAEAVRLEGECDRFFDRVSDLEMTLNKRKAELRDIHNALAQFGPGHSDTKPDTETLTDCVKKLVSERLTLGIEKSLAVGTLNRVREITECPAGKGILNHAAEGMRRYRDAMQAKEIVRLATARVGSEPGFLLTGIDILKEKIQRLQARIDRGLERGLAF